MKITGLEPVAPPTRLGLSVEVALRLLRVVASAAALALAASVLLAVLAGEARSQDRAVPRLRAQVAVTGEIVTIGDFFEEPGPLAATPLFRAPDLGTTGPVPARRVADLARAAGLGEVDLAGLVEVSVARIARPVESAELARLVAVELLRRPGRSDDLTVDDVEVVFDAPVEPRHASLDSLAPVRVVSLTAQAQSGRFDALVQIDKGETTERLRLRGTAIETVPVAVLARALSRGDIVGKNDVVVERQPRARAGALRGLLDPREVVGLQARRALRVGQAIATADFARPEVVARGDTVTVIFRSAALQVTGRGQAQQSGAVGDVVSILNPQSKRTLHATVTGPGRVEISAAKTALAGLER